MVAVMNNMGIKVTVDCGCSGVVVGGGILTVVVGVVLVLLVLSVLVI